MPSPGQRNGRLEFIGYNEGNKRVLRVRCDCGIEKTVDVRNWRKTFSCGCLMRESVSARMTTHGLTRGSSRGGRRSAVYEIWGGMIQRCTNPKNPNYPNYGGRGITICERWMTVENFLSDMGARPSSRHSIDRIDVNGNYEPGNVRWATQKEQMRNMRSNVHVEVDGVRMTMTEAAERAGVPSDLFAARIKRGWTPEKAANATVKSRPKLDIKPGQRFGRLTVVADIGKARKGSNHVCYQLKCDCGAFTEETGAHLVAGRKTYCTQRCRLRKESRE